MTTLHSQSQSLVELTNQLIRDYCNLKVTSLHILISLVSQTTQIGEQTQTSQWVQGSNM
jgi:hypothetical protein